MNRDPMGAEPGPTWIQVGEDGFDDAWYGAPDEDLICPACPGTSDPGFFRESGESAGRRWAAFTCGHVVTGPGRSPAGPRIRGRLVAPRAGGDRGGWARGAGVAT
jgi:hypothetical protein